MILSVPAWTQSAGMSALNVDEAGVLPVGNNTVFGAAAGDAPLGFRFPSLYFTNYLSAMSSQADSRPYWASAEEESAELETEDPSILLNNDIVAFYGHPNSRNMGILGRHPIEELDAMLGKVAVEYAEAGGGRGIR
ncbi:MAG: hypothetical protein LBL56_06110, partial [Treponema sp.]|nr:hypothetical protein [Treponema sp.]